MNNYYYLVTSLRPIEIDQDRLPYTRDELIEMVKLELDARDMRLFADLLLVYDHQNLINLIEHKGDPSQTISGNFTVDELRELMMAGQIGEEAVPSYLVKFALRMKDGQRQYAHHLLEDELLLGYIGYLNQSPSFLLKKFFQFSYALKNVMSALNARQFSLDREKFVLELDEIGSALRSSGAIDFGMTAELSWLEKVMSVFQQGDPLELELYLLQLQFDKLDELLLYEYFSVDKILGYYIKFMLMDRKLRLVETRGREVFNQITNQMSATIKID